jgi:protein tyrosine/serine phosphatase
MISKVTENLYIGEYTDIIGQTPEETELRLKRIKALGIEHVISLCSQDIEDSQIINEAETFKANAQSKNSTRICLHHQPVPVDRNFAGRGDPFKVGLELALNEINTILLREPNARIIIHCTAGIDRSPFVVASYLVRVCGLDLAEAYRQIKKVRPCVCEHPEWIWWPKTSL